MDQEFIIGKFIPPKISKIDANPIDLFRKKVDKNWHYSVSGRISLFHILKNKSIKNILLPAYLCRFVLESIKKLKIKPIFCDIDIEDLNPSLDSIDYLSKKFNTNTIIVPSLYGNPANLIEIEKYCNDKDIFLIDDAAQSFGTKLKERYVGTYGNAGFFSFAPGKTTVAHMGAFFWSDDRINIKREKHCLIHKIRWHNFRINRIIFEKYNKIHKKIIHYFSKYIEKIFNIYNDDICNFEKSILSGVLDALFNGNYNFRQKYFNEFYNNFKNSNYFSIIKSIRGIPHNHKIVLLANNTDIAKKVILYLKENKIYSNNGYKLLTNDLKYLSNSKIIQNRVVEIPIENNGEKMDYLFNVISDFKI